MNLVEDGVHILVDRYKGMVEVTDDYGDAIAITLDAGPEGDLSRGDMLQIDEAIDKLVARVKKDERK